MINSIPTAYWPPFYYYYLLREGIPIEIYETYQKRSMRNKCNILSSQGIKTLSIPLSKGKHESQLITDVKISYQEDWVKQHLSTISTCYRKAPYYVFYIDQISDLLSNHEDKLHPLNTKIQRWVMETFFDCEDLVFSTSFSKSNFDIIERLFQTKPITYNTVYSNIEPRQFSSLSILDMLFNVGPEITFYLQDVRNGIK